MDWLILGEIIELLFWYDKKQRGDMMGIGVRNGDDNGESVRKMVLGSVWWDWMNGWGMRMDEVNRRYREIE